MVEYISAQEIKSFLWYLTTSYVVIIIIIILQYEEYMFSYIYILEFIYICFSHI